MARKRIDYKLESILLKRLEIDVMVPFTPERMKEAKAIIKLGHRCDLDKAKKVKGVSVICMPALEVEILDGTNEESKIEFAKIEIYFAVRFTLPQKLRKKEYADVLGYKSLEEAWPYFRENLDSVLRKAGYFPFCLGQFEDYSDRLLKSS